MKQIIGIDPGLTGAIALLYANGEFAGLSDMPVMSNGRATGSVKTKVNSAEVARQLREITSHDPSGYLVVMEEPDPMPSFKGRPMPAASSKSMGRSIGVIEGVCAALGLSIELVKPAQWKKALGLPRDKEVCRTKAIEWYPAAPLGRKKDHNRAEAILIARWGTVQP